MKTIEIEKYYDGWEVIVDGKQFSWYHYNEDLGTKGIKELLEYLGHTVNVEECFE